MESIVHEFLESLATLNLNSGLSEFLSEGYGYFCAFFLAFTEKKIQELDDMFFENKNTRPGYKVVRKDDMRTLETKLGTLSYKRRYYHSDKEGYHYLVDDTLSVNPRTRVEKGLAADLCTKATEMSYARSSQAACSGRVSRQTVKSLIHQVKEKPITIQKPRLEVKEIHLQCDEDHVSLQKGKSRRTIAKLVTIHEEVKQVGTSKRYYLPHKHHLVGRSDESNAEFWQRVDAKITELYGQRDKTNPLKVYLHGDGASWIKAGTDYVPHSYFVLDKYHFMKELTRLAAYEPTYVNLLYDAVYSFDLGKLEDVLDIFVNSEICTEEEAGSFHSYYSNHYSGIKIWQSLGPVKSRSCAEGLVSHTLSSRLSSRPCAWSYRGLDDVSRLRVHLLNGGEIKASDFDLLIEHKTPLVKEEKIRQTVRKGKKKEYDFAPLTTSAFKRSKRDALYRFFQSIKEGGYKS